MTIPLNGRIAIIDDEIDQALPLIRIFSKNQIPYTFYKGDDLLYLPEENRGLNDIRILFLDINLIGNTIQEDRAIKSVLIGVLSRVISKDNYPYLLIYWSRTEEQHSQIVRDIFENDLQDRKPIDMLPFVKSDYFPNMGSEEQSSDKNLLEELNKQLIKTPAYTYLLKWENEVHKASDKTLQTVFNNIKSKPEWENKANFLISKLGLSYSGKHFFKQEPIDQLKSSLSAFNNVFIDTLDYSINTLDGTNVQTLKYEIEDRVEHFNLINKKLLFSEDTGKNNYSGTILECLGTKYDDEYVKGIFNDAISSVKMCASIDKGEPNITGNQKKRQLSSKRSEIRSNWKKIWFIVTPLCDFIQGKIEFNKILRGIIIKSEYKEFIEDRSEAIFVSPPFLFDDSSYILILHLRHFFSLKTIPEQKNLVPILRARQQLLAEVQSKLARHMNRQGILFLDEKL